MPSSSRTNRHKRSGGTTVQTRYKQASPPDRISKIWLLAMKDPQTREALAALRKDGLDLESPDPPAGRLRRMIASVPLLPERVARRKLLCAKDLKQYWPLVRLFHRLATECESPHSQIIVSCLNEKSLNTAEIPHIVARLRETKNFLEQFLSWNWSLRQRNPRLGTIAAIRWNLRWYTTAKHPHDRELTEILDAVYRAAGIKEGFRMDAEALKQLEVRERDGRRKDVEKLRSIDGTHKMIMHFR